MVVAEIVGVVYELPVARKVPLDVYHEIVPVDTAPKVKVPVPQLAAGVVEEIVGKTYTIACAVARVAVVQPFAVASQ